MPTTFGNTFVKGFLVTTALASAYQVPSSLVASVINHARVNNYGTTPETFSIQIIPSGQSAADRFIAVKDRQIEAGGELPISVIIGEEMQSGDDLQIIASANTKLSISLGGSNKTST